MEVTRGTRVAGVSTMTPSSPRAPMKTFEPSEIAPRRLAHQLVMRPASRVRDVVTALGALQAQDDPGALSSVALRTNGSTIADVERPEALATLARRYFVSHGPARIRTLSGGRGSRSAAPASGWPRLATSSSAPTYAVRSAGWAHGNGRRRTLSRTWRAFSCSTGGGEMLLGRPREEARRVATGCSAPPSSTGAGQWARGRGRVDATCPRPA